MPGFAFIVSHQSARFDQPAEGPLHDPTHRQQDKSFGWGIGHIRPLDDSQSQSRVPEEEAHLFDPVFALPCIAPIGKKGFQSQVEVGKKAEEDFRAVAVLHAGGRDHHPEEVSAGICEDVAFATVDLFTRIVTAARRGYRVGAFDALTVDDGDAGGGVFFP